MIILKKTKRIIDNDIYFFEIVGERLVVNNNYKGILVFNYNFELLKEIEIYDDLVIDFSIKCDNRILLICSENEKVVSIDLTNYKYECIALKEFSKMQFYSSNTDNAAELLDGNFHDFEMLHKYVVGVSEDYITIMDRESGMSQKYYPSIGYSFLRCKIMELNNNAFFYMLSGNKANACEAIIERVLLSI